MLTEWMAFKSVDDAALAIALGNGITVANIEAMRRAPHRLNSDTVRDIAKALGVPVGHLWREPREEDT